VIADQIVFGPTPVEELKDLRIVVLMDLHPRDFHRWPPTSAAFIVLRGAAAGQRAAFRPACVVARMASCSTREPVTAHEPVSGLAYDGGMTFAEQLHQSIESRLQTLVAEINKLEHAQEALNNGSAEPASRAERNGTQSKPRTRQPKPKRRTRVLHAGQIERILAESSDGLSTRGIAEQGNADASQVLTLLRELENAGQVRRTGQRRGTRWHRLTDEDRIAERAAELAARSKSAKQL
jgi:hypothetical protein